MKFLKSSVSSKIIKIMTTRKKFCLSATIYDKRGRVLAKGENSYLKTHPYQKECAHKVGLKLGEFIHAEIAALMRVRHGTPHKISIERYGKSGQPLTAAPCPVCSHAIKLAGISLIEYTIG